MIRSSSGMRKVAVVARLPYNTNFSFTTAVVQQQQTTCRSLMMRVVASNNYMKLRPISSLWSRSLSSSSFVLSTCADRDVNDKLSRMPRMSLRNSNKHRNIPGVVMSSLYLNCSSQHQYRTFFSFGRNADKPPSTNIDGAATATGSTHDSGNNSNDFNDSVFTTTTSTTSIGTDDEETSTLTVDETLNKLFEEQSQTGTSDAWYSTAENAAAGAVWDPTWYNVADNAILSINFIQQTSGLPYGLSIVAATATLRIGLFPLMVIAQRAASRMAYVQPELQIIKDRYERISAPTRADQQHFSTNMKALFAKYKVNPLQTVIAPIIQVPLFIGMFFGLKKVSTYFPDELKVGGMFWFVDLSVPDPYYILPLMSSMTFLILVELGKEQMLRAGGSSVMMLNVFRFLSVISLPMIMNFEASMLLYWVSNNLLTCAQTVALKSSLLRKQFGILDPPQPVAGADPEKDGIVASVTDLVKRAQGKPVTEADKIQKHNHEVEAKKVSTRLTRATRERAARRRPTGITGTRNY